MNAREEVQGERPSAACNARLILLLDHLRHLISFGFRAGCCAACQVLQRLYAQWSGGRGSDTFSPAPVPTSDRFTFVNTMRCEYVVCGVLTHHYGVDACCLYPQMICHEASHSKMWYKYNYIQSSSQSPSSGRFQSFAIPTSEI
jgi:hypothetical protein